MTSHANTLELPEEPVLFGRYPDTVCKSDYDALRTVATQLAAENKELRALYAAAKKDEKLLRHLLFLQHGSAEHYLYGDDGERHCNACMIDFNKDSPQEIERKICNYNLRKYAAEHPECVVKPDAALREGGSDDE